MALSMYQASVAVYARILTALSGTIDKAAAHATARKIEPAILINARLSPDMWSFGQQVRAACNHATRGPARIGGLPIPDFEGADASFADLKARIAWALTFLGGVNESQFEGAGTRDVVFPSGGQEIHLSGCDYLLGFSMPNFYFHATTAYDILRHNGVPLVKDDFVGTL